MLLKEVPVYIHVEGTRVLSLQETCSLMGDMRKTSNLFYYIQLNSFFSNSVFKLTTRKDPACNSNKKIGDQ